MFNDAADNENFNENCNEAEIESLKSEIARVKLAIAVGKNEIIEKDKYLAEISKDIRADMEDITEQKLMSINKLDKTIQEGCEELKQALVQRGIEEDRNQNLEKNLLDIIDKYESMKITIDDSKENSKDLMNKLQVITAEIKTITDECKTVQKKCDEITKKAANHSNEENSKEISKYQSAIKRMRLKIMSIQTALAQKVKDCEALSTFHDNFAK